MTDSKKEGNTVESGEPDVNQTTKEELDQIGDGLEKVAITTPAGLHHSTDDMIFTRRIISNF